MKRRVDLIDNIIKDLNILRREFAASVLTKQFDEGWDRGWDKATELIIINLLKTGKFDDLFIISVTELLPEQLEDIKNRIYNEPSGGN